MSATTHPIRVFAIDDHPTFRAGLAAIVQAQPALHWLGCAETAAAGIERCLALRPDVVIVDLRLPDLDGVSLIERLAVLRPGSAFIALTTYGGDDRVRRAFAAGASGYLTKTASAAELTTAILRVAGGGRALPHEIAAELAAGIGREVLTDRERDVVRHLAAGLENKAIAEALGVSVGTVRTHVQHVLDKLGCSTRTEAVQAAIRRGFIDGD